MSVNMRELLFCFGKGKQTNIDTANLVANMWRLNKNNVDLIKADFVTEDDAAELGKGHEFATATYASHLTVGPSNLEKYMGAEIMAWAASFGLGSVVKTGTGPWTYTCVPQDPVTLGLETPYFSFVEQIRPGGSAIWDKMYVGCRVKGFLCSLRTAPGRASSTITIEIVGSGKITEPSAITIPAKTAEKEYSAGSITLTVQGYDYVTNKNLLSLDFGWDNNPRENTGFYPGSGTQDGYQKKGRIENGDRAGILRFTCRVRVGTPEYGILKARTTGTAVISQSFDASNDYTATFHQVGFRGVEVGNDDGLATIQVECSPQYHASNGMLTIAAKCQVDGICQ